MYTCVKAIPCPMSLLQAFYSVAETASSLKKETVIRLTAANVSVWDADPDFTMGWRHDINYKNISLGLMITGRFGGIVTSQTQAFMDAFGVSKVSAEARDNGGVMLDGHRYDAERYYNTVGGQGLMSYYTYDATNVRLQELFVDLFAAEEMVG